MATRTSTSGRALTSQSGNAAGKAGRAGEPLAERIMNGRHGIGKAGKMRIEKDVMGAVKVPADSYYGSFTQRAIDNFQLSGEHASPVFIKSMVLVKLAAAEVNAELGMLDKRKAKAIVRAAEEAIGGKFDRDLYVLDVFQAGAGTPFNMNVNEVLANRANELMHGGKGTYEHVHPNDHVNLGQSSNDVGPATVRIALLLECVRMEKSLGALEKELRAKARKFAKITTVGRTHLQDAVPITLGQQFATYADSVRDARAKLADAKKYLLVLPLGGTALGTGINAHPEFGRRVVARLAMHTGLGLKHSKNPMVQIQDYNDFLNFSNALRMAMMAELKMANDLKLLVSGPNAGLAEITMPEVEPGSSIMPGKVNPSILEAVEMVAYEIFGADTAVMMGVQASQLQLNITAPLMAHKLIKGTALLSNTAEMFAQKCIAGVKAEEVRIEENLRDSFAAATALVPIIGYKRTAELVAESVERKMNIVEIVGEKVERGEMAQEAFAILNSPDALTRPNLRSPTRKAK